MLKLKAGSPEFDSRHSGIWIFRQKVQIESRVHPTFHKMFIGVVASGVTRGRSVSNYVRRSRVDI